MARFSDLSRVTTNDITVLEDRLIISFNTRKNDQSHKGHTVHLLASFDSFCPVSLYKRYLSFLSSPDKPYSGFILPSFTKKKGSFSPSPSTPSSYSAMRYTQRRLLSSIGLDPDLFGLHSGRRGAATDSAAAGNDYSETCIFGGWSKNSSMPEHYDSFRLLVARLKVAKSLRLSR